MFPSDTGLNLSRRQHRLYGTAMTEQCIALAELITACWKDDAQKACFLAAPRVLQAEHPIEALVHPGLEIAENTNETM